MARGVERAFIGFVASGSIALTVVHTLEVLVRIWLPQAASGQAAARPAVTAWALILVATGFACCHLFLPQNQPRRRLALIGLALAASAGTISGVLFSSVPAGIAIALAGSLQTQLAVRISRLLPGSTDGVFGRRRLLSLLWALCGVLLLVQTGRLGVYMADPASDWWLTTRNEWWAKHMCMPAYVQAADYHRQGEQNVYDVRHYAATTRDARAHLAVRNMDFFAGDPFQYPPQFLLIPCAALALTDDFLVMRTVWYTLQVLGFLTVALLLARRVSRSGEGWSPMLLVPAVLLSVPAMQCFQYGQFHLAAIVLAVGAMLAFEKGRHALGGGLLAIAILAKIFPAILLVPLFVRRRWNCIGWTALFGGLITLAALLLLGSSPFSAFISYQLPRLSGADALSAFTRDWPELREVITANVISLYGVVFKLRELGIPGMTEGLAVWVMRISWVFVLLAAVRASGRNTALGAAEDGERPRLREPWLWLGLLNLAALQTSLAWGDYVTVGSVWLLSLLGSPARWTTGQRWFIGACWAFSALELGIVPMPVLPPVALMMTATTAGAFLMLALNGWLILGAGPARSSLSLIPVHESISHE